MNLNAVALGCAGVFAALALSACGLSRPAVERTSYYLFVPRPDVAVDTPKPAALKVRPLRAAPLYERSGFVYRVADGRIESDFYNEFAESPDAMITSLLISWLKAAHLFTTVVEPGLQLDTPYALDGTIIAFYGDLRPTAQPAAVVEIQFYVVRSGSLGRELVLDRIFKERIALANRTPRALVAGYNEALQRIFGALEKDLAQLDWKQSAAE
jgi:cholesterol transport system auxiliary component